jgi:hypothetical protein
MESLRLHRTLLLMVRAPGDADPDDVMDDPPVWPFSIVILKWCDRRRFACSDRRVGLK